MIRAYPAVATMLFLYVLHLCAKFSGVLVPAFFSHFFADLLCLPLMLSLMVLGMRRLLRRPDFYLTGGMVVFAVVYTAVVFEWLLPWVNAHRFVADPQDVLMYGIGGVFFAVFQRWLVPA